MPDSSIPPWLKPYDPVVETPHVGEIAAHAKAEDVPQTRPIGTSQVRLHAVRGLSMREAVMGPDTVRMIIGRGREEADLSVIDPALAARQLVLIRLGDELLLINCVARTPLRVNGVTVEQAAIPVPSRNLIEIGNSAFLLHATSERPASEGRHVAARPGETDSVPGPPDCRVKLTLDDQSAVCTDRQIFIGSSHDCELAFRQRGLAAYHAMVSPTEHGVMLIPIDTAGITLGGRPVLQATRLEHRAIITILERKIHVDFDGDPHSRAAQLYGNNVMQVNDFTFRSLHSDAARSFTIARNSGVRSIGRADECDIVIKETSMSRQHADLAPNLNNVLIIDKNSSNGCFINDQKVTQHRLRAGDFVEFGRNPFLVHYS